MTKHSKFPIAKTLIFQTLLGLFLEAQHAWEIVVNDVAVNHSADTQSVDDVAAGLGREVLPCP